jgi:hypothetical protein
MVNKKPMFPLVKVFMDRMRKKGVREKVVDRLGDHAMSGVGQSLGEEAGRRVTRRIKR